MIKVNIKYKDSFINEIIISGHALYDDFGKDIVCAAVSSIFITTVNSILSLDKDAITYEELLSGFKITNKNNEIANKLLQVMIDELEELELDYPKNIKIKED